MPPTVISSWWTRDALSRNKITHWIGCFSVSNASLQEIRITRTCEQFSILLVLDQCDTNRIFLMVYSWPLTIHNFGWCFSNLPAIGGIFSVHPLAYFKSLINRIFSLSSRHFPPCFLTNNLHHSTKLNALVECKNELATLMDGIKKHPRSHNSNHTVTIDQQ